MKPWIGIRSAEEFGPKCPTVLDLTQMSENERKSNDVEDCLNMAIYTKDVCGCLCSLMFYSFQFMKIFSFVLAK